MTRYIFILIIVATLANMAEKYDYKRPVDITTGKVKHSSLAGVFFIGCSLVLIMTAGLRYSLGTDFFSYYGAYYKYNDLDNALKTMKEPGIRLIYMLAKAIDGKNQTPILLCSIFSLGLLLRTFYRHSDKLTFVAILFLFLGVWGHSFNAVRQYLAVGIVFSGIGFMKERKFIPYAICVAIAYLFHRSASVMIIPYFIVNNKICVRNIVLTIIGTIVVLVLYDIAFDAVGVIMDTDRLDSEYATRSVNTLRILVSVVPAIFGIFVYYKYGRDVNLTFYVNLLIIHATIMTMASGSAYFGRIGSYTLPFVVLAVPEICKKLKGQYQLLFTAAIFILYFAYWVVDMKGVGSYYWVFDYMYY